jgi:hypothetical protein
MPWILTKQILMNSRYTIVSSSLVGAASFGIKKLTVFIIYGELPDVYYYSELVSESMQAMPSISTLEP